MSDNSDAPSRAIAETESYMVWEVQEPDARSLITSNWAG